MFSTAIVSCSAADVVLEKGAGLGMVHPKLCAPAFAQLDQNSHPHQLLQRHFHGQLGESEVLVQRLKHFVAIFLAQAVNATPRRVGWDLSRSHNDISKPLHIP